MNNETMQTLLVIFTAVTSVAVLIQAIVILAIGLAARKALKKGMDLADEASVNVLPVIATSRKVIEDLAPKIKTISDQLVETTKTLKTEADRVRVTVDDVVDRTRGQAARVDEMISGTLNGVAHATTTLQEGIAAPIRQIHGVLNGIRAGFDVLRHRSPNSHVVTEEDIAL